MIDSYLDCLSIAEASTLKPVDSKDVESVGTPILVGIASKFWLFKPIQSNNEFIVVCGFETKSSNCMVL